MGVYDTLAILGRWDHDIKIAHHWAPYGTPQALGPLRPADPVEGGGSAEAVGEAPGKALQAVGLPLPWAPGGRSYSSAQGCLFHRAKLSPVPPMISVAIIQKAVALSYTKAGFKKDSPAVESSFWDSVLIQGLGRARALQFRGFKARERRSCCLGLKVGRALGAFGGDAGSIGSLGMLPVPSCSILGLGSSEVHEPQSIPLKAGECIFGTCLTISQCLRHPGMAEAS